MADAEAPPLYGDESEIACIEGVGNDAYAEVAKQRKAERVAREQEEDSTYSDKADKALKECKDSKIIRAPRSSRFKIYMKYEGRKGPSTMIKVKLPQHGGFEDGPSLGIKKMFVDNFNRLRQMLSYYSVHLRSELGIGIADEDAISGFVGHGGMILVCDGSPPGKQPENGVYAWGKHTFSDPNGDSPARVLSVDRKRVAQVACGVEHTQLVTEGGRVFGWGMNDFGQLGTGDETARPLPTLARLPYEAFIGNLTCGYHFGMGLTKKGELWTWGRMQASNYPRLFVDQWCNGYESRGEKGLRGLKIEQVAAGEMHMAAIAQGELFTWGYNDYGQLGWGLHGEGRTGQQKPRQCPVEGKAKHVACGGAHTVVVMEDGRVYGFGSNAMGQLNHGLRDIFPQPMEIACPEKMTRAFAGRQSSIVITDKDRALIWGRMQAEAPKDPDAPAAEGEDKPAADVMGLFSDQQAHVDGEVVSGALGEAHGLLALKEGRVMGWGYNRLQQAIGGPHKETFVPPLPAPIEAPGGKAVRVACGGQQSCAVISFSPY